MPHDKWYCMDTICPRCGLHATNVFHSSADHLECSWCHLMVAVDYDARYAQRLFYWKYGNA